MKKSTLRATAALQALALLGAGAGAAFIAAPAAAQDYTSGAITGTITNDSGAPVSGASVSLRSLAQGQVRTFTTNANGAFTAAGLAPGQYELTVDASGYNQSQDVITIAASQSSTVTVGLVTQSLGNVITVTGRARQVQTQGTTGLNIDVQAVNANAPIAHSITAVTLLAPTAQKGVSGFGDVPSVGGSSVAENAYYINGLNITNPDTYVGSARVPFYFYKNVDVQTGGYAAEYGRATGSIINATTKSGTNDAFIALHIDWEPAGLQSHSPNLGSPTNPSNIGNLNEYDRKQLTVEAGGAIIPDHLFVYGLIQPQRNTHTVASASGGYYETQKANDPFWGGKVDAYINPTQHFEFTIFDTRSTTKYTDYNFTPNADFSGGTIGTPINGGTLNRKSGGLNWVARYTGDVSPWLTLSGAYGVSKDTSDSVPGNPDNYFVYDIRSGIATRVSQQQTFTSTNIVQTKRRFYRGDADIRFSAAGEHHVRLGFDNEDLSELKTTDLTGGYPIQYRYYSDYIYLIYEHLGGNVSARDSAYYIEDSWKTPLDGLTINYGLRDDVFKQTNLAGEQYLEMKNNFGPRISFSYSPPSMSKWNFHGSYGRYFIPPAMNLGFRGKDLYFAEAFEYPAGFASDGSDYNAGTGYDPVTGLPLGPIGPAIPGLAGSSDCPTDISGAPGNPINGAGSCALYGGGIQNPAIAKVVPGTKATYEDEFTLGARYQVNSLLSVGLNGTYRKLGRVSEDTDFAPQLANYWCDTTSTHYDATRCDFYSNNSTYMIWNVSDTNSLTVNDWYSALNGEVLPVTLTKGMHFPNVKRTYKAVVLDFARADDGHWMANGSVTWSKLRGNTEGTVKSDAGNSAQQDAGSTQDFDYLGLSDYGYGRLPNDHTWQFKLYGAYHFNKMFTLGANIFVQSPMPGSCLGYHPRYPQPSDGTFDPSYAYGASSHFCGTGALNVTGQNGVTGAGGYYTSTAPAIRGAGWKSDWLKQVDLSARVNIPYGNSDNRKITLRADVFNVFNAHAVIQRNAQHENSRGTGTATCGTGIRECWRPNPLYLTPLYYQEPRYVRLGLDVMFGAEAAPPPPPPPPPPPAPEPAPATQTCADGSVILATDACPVPPPPPPPEPAPERG